MAKKEARLTQVQIDETLRYFDAFNKGFLSQRFTPITALQAGKYYTPDIVNQFLKEINSNPNKPEEKALEQALTDTNNSEDILRNYAVYFEINNIFYKRLISFNSGLPAWNLTFDCTNITEETEYVSKEFKKDLKVIDDFCSSFNIKKEFRIIITQILRQGVYFGVLRDEADIFSWQELPPDFCTITGDSNVGKLFSFDFAYFINKNGSNIDLYPAVFKKLLNKIYKQISEEYKPSDKDNRHSSYLFNIDLSPRDNFFCFTLDNGLTTLIPYYCGLFPDILLQPMMRNLERNKSMIAAQKLLVNLLDTYDNAKSGTVTNQYKVTPKDIGQFMALVKQAIGEVVHAVAIPAKDTKVVDFDVEAKNRYTDYQRNIAANAVSSSASMLTENKLNTFESELALNIDENFVKSFYGQFETFLNYYLNRKMSKYHFNFKLHDTNTKMDVLQRRTAFKDFASMGLVDINLYARATNQTVFEAQRALKYTKSLNIEDDLISLKSLNNQSQEDGRPEVEDSINDNTSASKERGSNGYT